MFHVNPKTGDPTPCKAVVRCPFGDINEDHWRTEAEARAAYEEQNPNATVPQAQVWRTAAVRRKLAALAVESDALREKLDAVKAEEGRLQSERVKTVKKRDELNSAVRGIDAMTKLDVVDDEDAATLARLRARMVESRKDAVARLDEIDARRPEVSREISAIKNEEKQLRSEAYGIEHGHV